MPSMDDLARTERLAWDVAEGAPADEAARVMCDVLKGAMPLHPNIDPASGSGIAQGFAYLDPALMTVMAENFGTPATNPFLRVMPFMPVGRFHHCTELIDLDRVRRTRFHADWWIPVACATTPGCPAQSRRTHDLGGTGVPWRPRLVRRG